MRIYIDFPLKVAAWTHIAEVGVNVNIYMQVFWGWKNIILIFKKCKKLDIFVYFLHIKKIKKSLFFAMIFIEFRFCKSE